MSAVNFDARLIAVVMYLLNDVFFYFVLIQDYCIPLSLDEFSNVTTLLSLLLKVVLVKTEESQ